jgi:hypothetical protein
MDYQQALVLQIWCYSNLVLNVCYKAEVDGRWQVVLGLPDGSRRTLDGSPVRLAWASDPGQGSPRRAVPGLVGELGRLWAKTYLVFNRDGMGSDPADSVVFHDVPVSSLQGETYPVLYDVLEGRTVLVFSKAP